MFSICFCPTYYNFLPLPRKTFSLSCLSTNSCLCVCVSHSVVSSSLQPHTIGCQALLSMGFPRQEYWNRLPFLSPGDLPDTSMFFLPPEPPGKPRSDRNSRPQGQEGFTTGHPAPTYKGGLGLPNSFLK